MKIILAGGGSGGHFYPLIAVTEAIRDVIRDRKLLQAKIHYLAPSPYNAGMLFDNEIEFHKIHAGKMRRNYNFLQNIPDLLLTALGFIESFFKVFSIFPDIIFSKGGFMSIPVVFAGKILGIPIVIHESDSVPGRANLKAGKFANRVAIAFAEAAEYFDKDKVAWTGNPLRKEIMDPKSDGAHEYLGLEKGVPVILVMGGSLGAQKINNCIVDALPFLLDRYQIIHQTGKVNFPEIEGMTKISLEGHEHKSRYHLYDYLNPLALRMSASVTNLIVSRGGSTIFEIAMWGIPSILIPITDSNGDHQRKNSYNYARSGGAIVIEENNMTPEILLTEINNILDNPDRATRMREGALSFAKPDAARKIAEMLVDIALTHEK